MNTIGIIAEYNPFHNGHHYQIETIKAQTGAKHVVVVMSGDFVQRGTPAWTDKYLRAQMTLSCGADMVFELPVSFATASAEAFARAGVSILTSLCFVDGICFGSECDNLPLLQEIAEFLAVPSNSFEESIRLLTAKGISYPAARAQALSEYFNDPCQNNPTLFSAPNNILAIEYLKAIRQSDSHLIPFLIPRKDSGYHSENIGTAFASATAIRKASFSSIEHIKLLSNSKDTNSHFDTIKPPNPKEVFLRTIASAVPKEVLHILEENDNRYPITENDFSTLLYYRLIKASPDDTNILDMTEEILYRIQKRLPAFTSFSDFTEKIKTKQYTYSRISRVLLHCLLDITDLKNSSISNEFSIEVQHNKNVSPTDKFSLPYVPYARLLGFRREASILLRNETAIPIITKPADGLAQMKEFYTEENYMNHACTLYNRDIFSSNLYQQVQNTTLGCKRKNEYYNQPIIL